MIGFDITSDAMNDPISLIVIIASFDRMVLLLHNFSVMEVVIAPLSSTIKYLYKDVRVRLVVVMAVFVDIYIGVSVSDMSISLHYLAYLASVLQEPCRKYH